MFFKRIIIYLFKGYMVIISLFFFILAMFLTYIFIVEKVELKLWVLPPFFTYMGVTFFLFFIKIQYPTLKNIYVENSIVDRGEKIEATILGVRQTNVYINDVPQIALKLKYHFENNEFVIEKKAVVSYLHIGDFKPGAQLSLIIDAKHPKRAIIDPAYIKSNKEY